MLLCVCVCKKCFQLWTVIQFTGFLHFSSLLDDMQNVCVCFLRVSGSILDGWPLVYQRDVLSVSFDNDDGEQVKISHRCLVELRSSHCEAHSMSFTSFSSSFHQLLSVVDRGMVILEEPTPIRIEMVHYRIKVSRTLCWFAVNFPAKRTRGHKPHKHNVPCSITELLVLPAILTIHQSIVYLWL